MVTKEYVYQSFLTLKNELVKIFQSENPSENIIKVIDDCFSSLDRNDERLSKVKNVNDHKNGATE